MPRLALLTLLSICLIFQTSALVWMQTGMPLSAVTLQTESITINKNEVHVLCADEMITSAPYLPDCSNTISCDCIQANPLLFPPSLPMLAQLITKFELLTQSFAPYHTRAIPHYRPPIG